MTRELFDGHAADGGGQRLLQALQMRIHSDRLGSF
jgi:hypothetical protein